MQSTATHDCWELRMRMPDREALAAFKSVCEERGHEFELQSVYERWTPETSEPGSLSPAQREALLTARELGYFEIPREASLAAVSDELDISAQSVSERLRRAIPTLIDRTIGQPQE